MEPAQIKTPATAYVYHVSTTMVKHNWVAENRDALLSLQPPNDLPAQVRQRSRSLGRPRSNAIAKAGAILPGARWADAQSDDETDKQLQQQTYGCRHHAKACGSAALLLRVRATLRPVAAPAPVPAPLLLMLMPARRLQTLGSG